MLLTLDSIRDIKLYQRKRGYRFSLDALLLFDFVRLAPGKPVKLADLGAGSGVIGLLLAKRYEAARIWLFELQEGLFSMARKNIPLNGLEDRVWAVRADINRLAEDFPFPGLKGEAPGEGFFIGAGGFDAPPGGFDAVVSNPPFRKAQSGRICPDEEKAVARHELRMSLPALVRAAGRLVKAKGGFFMVYHPERLLEALGQLRDGGFEPKRLRFVHGRQGLPAKMVLMESVKGGSPGLCVEDPLFIYGADGAYTPQAGRIFEL